MNCVIIQTSLRKVVSINLLLSLAWVLLCPRCCFSLSAFCLLVLLCCGTREGCTPLLLAGRVTSSLRSELKMDFPIGQREGGPHFLCSVINWHPSPACGCQAQDSPCLTISCSAPWRRQRCCVSYKAPFLSLLCFVGRHSLGMEWPACAVWAEGARTAVPCLRGRFSTTISLPSP